MKRPCEVCARSQAVYAIVVGLRANETAIDVPNLSRLVYSAIKVPGKNGSCIVSDDQRALKPIASAARAMAGIEESVTGGKPASISIIVFSSKDTLPTTGS